MGDVVMRRELDGVAASVAVAGDPGALALGLGCTSSKPARVVEATPAAPRPPAASAPARPASARRRDPLAGAARGGAGGLRRPRSERAAGVDQLPQRRRARWSSSCRTRARRPASPTSRPRTGWSPRCAVERAAEGSRPLTRLVIADPPGRRALGHAPTATSLAAPPAAGRGRAQAARPGSPSSRSPATARAAAPPAERAGRRRSAPAEPDGRRGRCR